MIRACVITVSDTAAAGGREDTSGPELARRLQDLPALVEERMVVPDEPARIVDALRHGCATTVLVVLTGGTGLGPRDVTPQTVAPLLDYTIPGMAEAMRREGAAATPHAMLSRQLAGVIGSTLVLALPGSRRAAAESLEAVWEALPHALALLSGDTAHPERTTG